MASNDHFLDTVDSNFGILVSEDVPLLTIESGTHLNCQSRPSANMGVSEVLAGNEGTDAPSQRKGSLSLFPEAVVADSFAFKREGGKSTFDHDSAEEFYAPIAEYEGAHRYDPKFEWEPKEEKQVVRRVSISTIQSANACCLTVH